MRKLELNKLSDEELFQLIKEQHHNCAYAELYDRYWFVLWRFALRHQTNPDEAQDSLQDVFTYLWENRQTIHIKSKVSSFLYRATLNQVLKKIDRNNFINAYVKSLGDKLKQHENYVEELVFEKELHQNLVKAIEEMPSKMRAVFEASRFEGLSYEEIAQKFNISKETVKSQIKNALKIVRKHVNTLFFLFL